MKVDALTGTGGQRKEFFFVVVAFLGTMELEANKRVFTVNHTVTKDFVAVPVAIEFEGYPVSNGDFMISLLIFLAWTLTVRF